MTSPPPRNTYTLPEGIEISFTDSGPPPNSEDYTTLLIIHGSAFNAYQFHKVHFFAHTNNLRTVLFHRRDHIGSTPYSDKEVNEIATGERVFWERLSGQVAHFIKIFIEKERIPKLKMSSTTLSGGIAIMGWSAGCQLAASFFGATQNQFIPGDVYSLLQEYVGKCMIYDPPPVAFGYPFPADNKNYIPWEDTTLKPENIPVVFSEWVSSYYSHPGFDPATGSLPSTVTVHQLDGIRIRAEKTTISSWTEEEKVKGIEMAAMKTEIITFTPPPQKVLRSLTENAFFDAEAHRSWFPNVEVAYVGVTHTNWMCAWAEVETKRIYEEAEKKNGRIVGRKIKYWDMVGSNHFPHWDEPDRFVEVCANAIRK